MARTQAFDLFQGANYTATTSKILYQARSFDQAIFIVRTTLLNGAPNPATLDVDIEQEAESAQAIAGQGTDSGTQRRWIRLQTKKMGIITAADTTPVFTVGDFSLGTFAQVTQATALENVEVRGLDSLIGKALRVTLRIAFTGGASPSWRVSVLAVLKASSVG